MTDVMSKVDVTIDVINNSDIVKRLKELKLLIESDKEISNLRQKFDHAKKIFDQDNTKIEELVEAKKNFYKHSVVAEYRILYTNLNHAFLKFNNDITALLKVGKGCHKF